MTDNTQSEALRLAAEFEKDGWIAGTKQWCAEVSAELRRQHVLLDEQQLTIAALNSCIGCETTTENLTAVGRLEVRIADLKAQLESIGAGGVNGPLMGQPQAMPDLSALTERGAKAWAGVDAQGLRAALRTQQPAPSAQAADSVLEDAALSSEQQRAIFEAYESAASESYFEVRPQIDCNDRRRVFKAGYERGWDAARKQGGAT